MSRTSFRARAMKFLTLLIATGTLPLLGADLVTSKTTITQHLSIASTNQPKIAETMTALNAKALLVYRDLPAKSTTMKALDALKSTLAVAPKTEANLVLAKKEAALRSALTSYAQLNKDSLAKWTTLFSNYTTAHKNLNTMHAQLKAATDRLGVDATAPATVSGFGSTLPGSLNALTTLSQTLATTRLAHQSALSNISARAAELKVASAAADSRTREAVAELIAAGATEEETKAVIDSMGQMQEAMALITNSSRAAHEVIVGIIVTTTP
jgi:hypothetical protein